MRTIFNILGPLTNPADAPNILMGVFHPDLVGIQVRALQRLGAEHALVVYGRDGMDEVSLGAATMVGEFKDGGIREYEIHPEDFGLTMASNRALKVETPERVKAHAAVGARQRARPGARHRACSTPAWRCTPPTWRRRMADGVALAREALASGAALAKLQQFVGARRKAAALAADERHPRQRIVAVKREEVAAARARARPGVAARAMPSARRGSATSSARCARKIAAGQRRRDRRDQEGQPEQGRAARALRAGRDRRQLRRGTAPPA